MLKYIAKQIMGLVILLLIISFAAFFIVRLLPVDPAKSYLNAINAPITEEAIEMINEELGLNEPIMTQYSKWMIQILKGDLGYSYMLRKPVTQLMLTSLKYTGILALATIGWIFIISTALGVISALKANTPIDSMIRGFNFLGTAMPDFWLGFILVAIFAIFIKVLPVQGATTVKHLILPSLTLAYSYIAIYAKLLRNTILEIQNQPYIFYARSRGFSTFHIVYHHIIPNALVPIITTMGMNLGGILSGSVIVETVFSWPGLGRMCLDAVAGRDYPILQGYILFVATIFVMINIVADICTGLLYPKLRIGERK